MTNQDAHDRAVEMPMSQRDASGVRARRFEVRQRLVEALTLDLVGPKAGSTLAEERLPGWG